MEKPTYETELYMCIFTLIGATYLSTGKSTYFFLIGDSHGGYRPVLRILESSR